MRNLKIYIEIDGKQRFVGNIEGNSYEDACFSYSKEYMVENYGNPISISLPFREGQFSAVETRNFFEGLLPEGFSRRAVANWIKTDEEDYVTILSVLGRECLGAIKVVEEENENDSSYEPLSIKEVKALAEEGATKSTQILMETHLSLTGATGKVGLYYDGSKDKWYLPKGDAPSTHIVKQSHVRLAQIVLNEQLCMFAAKESGIEIPEVFVVNTGSGKDSEVLYATKRYDRKANSGRIISGHEAPDRLHQEDFAQAMGIRAVDKYEKVDSGYLRKMFALVRENCADPIGEQKKLWKMVCFNYLIGNTDCHIKNYSLLYESNLKRIGVAPAYDIVCTGVYNSTKEMSFYIEGEVNIEKINRKHFETAAKDVDMSVNMAMRVFDDLANGFEKSVKQAGEDMKKIGMPGVKRLQDKIIASGGYALLQ